MMDYVWINDIHPKMIMHPFMLFSYGSDLTDYKDRNGKKVFVEMVELCKRQKSGYVEYVWPWYDDKEKIVPKISYVEVFEPWG